MEIRPVGAKVLIISIGSVLLIEAALRAIAYPSMLLLAGARFVETVLILSINQVFGQGLSDFGLGRSALLSGLKRGFLWACAFGVLAALLLGLLLMLGLDPLAMIRTRLPPGKGDLILFFLTGVLVAPAAEEVFFRGILYGFFRRWGVAAALTLSTLAFVAAHLPGRGLPLTQAVGGLVFAISYEKEKNLLVPFTIHSLGNLAIFALSLLPDLAHT